MIIRIKDKQAERFAMQEQDRKREIAASRLYPYNVPNFQPLYGISCYKEIDTDNLYFDKDGNIQYDVP